MFNKIQVNMYFEHYEFAEIRFMSIHAFQYWSDGYSDVIYNAGWLDGITVYTLEEMHIDILSIFTF